MPAYRHGYYPGATRDGRSHRGQQRDACRRCRRDLTATSLSAIAGHRWPPEVILTSVRWYLRLTVLARQVTWQLAERGVDVPRRRC
jgi:hypothetical protein